MAGVAGTVCEIPLKRAFGVAFLPTGWGFDEHVLLLGETVAFAPGAGALQACHTAAPRFGDGQNRPPPTAGRGAFLLEDRYGGLGSGRLPGGDS